MEGMVDRKLELCTKIACVSCYCQSNNFFLPQKLCKGKKRVVIHFGLMGSMVIWQFYTSVKSLFFSCLLIEFL